MVCANCGATSDQGQRFCYNCGARLEPQQATPTLVVPPQNQELPPPAPPQPPTYQPVPGGYAPAVVPNSNLAVISLVSGILSWVVLPLIAAIVAIITGHMARNEIRQSGGSLTGDGLALIGMVLGYAQIALIILAVCVGIFFFIVVAAAA